ncbi:hypothetical protein B0H17DRAFT_1052770 [Mycena rosella]|uniref:F-box domain-containing protein n=1 Tax=Mycena rosella TaxID=1033263 RepID=A0AAD7DPN0_MYCRO|nr:hypothetical protein B0H17DRAFT_1052770 [Mycena rosella]
MELEIDSRAFSQPPSNLRSREPQAQLASTIHSLLTDPTTKAQIRVLLRSRADPPEQIATTVAALSDELARYDAEISSYENEVPRPRARLAKAQAERGELQSHYDDLRSLLSPVRRLPSEILAGIFAQCQIPSELPDSEARSLADLAQAPLLVLSQVSSRWHEIALCTPTLWDTIKLYSFDLWSTDNMIEQSMTLLRVALDRGANSPLNLEICTLGSMYSLDYTLPLQLLAQHCERWKTVSLLCTYSALRHLSGIRGKLPLLETLQIMYDTSDPLDLFDDAPTLRTFLVAGPAPLTVVNTHLAQLHMIGCLGHEPPQLPLTVSFMSRMPHGTHFRLEFFLRNSTDEEVLDMHIPPTASNIARLSMEVRDYFDSRYGVQTLDSIFTALTLPHLLELSFRSEQYPYSLMHWSHPAFLGLSTRSAFHTHLQSLHLSHVVITESELVESLATLPLLQRLSISDHQIIRVRRDEGTSQTYAVDALLITDSLFAKLTLNANSPPLVPHLRVLTCQSRLQFDDNIYLEFLLSRRRQTPSDATPFLSQMFWMPGNHRELDASVVAQLRELQIHKAVMCEFSRAIHWMPGVSPFHVLAPRH